MAEHIYYYLHWVPVAANLPTPEVDINPVSIKEDFAKFSSSPISPNIELSRLDASMRSDGLFIFRFGFTDTEIDRVIRNSAEKQRSAAIVSLSEDTAMVIAHKIQEDYGHIHASHPDPVKTRWDNFDKAEQKRDEILTGIIEPHALSHNMMRDALREAAVIGVKDEKQHQKIEAEVAAKNFSPRTGELIDLSEILSCDVLPRIEAKNSVYESGPAVISFLKQFSKLQEQSEKVYRQRRGSLGMVVSNNLARLCLVQPFLVAYVAALGWPAIYAPTLDSLTAIPAQWVFALPTFLFVLVIRIIWAAHRCRYRNEQANLRMNLKNLTKSVVKSTLVWGISFALLVSLYPVIAVVFADFYPGSWEKLQSMWDRRQEAVGYAAIAGIVGAGIYVWGERRRTGPDLRDFTTAIEVLTRGKVLDEAVTRMFEKTYSHNVGSSCGFDAMISFLKSRRDAVEQRVMEHRFACGTIIAILAGVATTVRVFFPSLPVS